MAKTPDRALSPSEEACETARTLYLLTDAGGSVMGEVLPLVMNESTVDMTPPPPLPRLLPVPIHPIPFPPIPALRNLLPQHCYPRERPTTRSHLTGEKNEEHYGI